MVCCFLLTSSLFASQAGKEFNEADADLNTTYQRVLSRIKDPQHRAMFVASQKAWLQFRDASVKFYGEYYPESKGGLFLNTDLTRERTKFFRQLLAEPPDKVN